MTLWGEVSAATTHAKAAAAAKAAAKGCFTPSEAADLVGAVRAREASPCGWHEIIAEGLVDAWRARLVEMALFRWESARRAQIVADVALEAERALEDRLADAGVRAPGPAGSVALRGTLAAAWRRD